MTLHAVSGVGFLVYLLTGHLGCTSHHSERVVLFELFIFIFILKQAFEMFIFIFI